MIKINELFNIEKFNAIYDENYYYLFRALNKGDHKDLKNGIISDENGRIIKIRTDRDRYVENPKNISPRYNKDEGISLVQVIDHIKDNHRLDTNCISLSCNANVSTTYGHEYYYDEYIIVKVSKKEIAAKVINAGEYILEKIEEMVQETIKKTSNNEIVELINEIDNQENLEHLSEKVIESYVLNVKNSKNYTGTINKVRSKESIGKRFNKYEELTLQQNLAKDKVVAKLTILEQHNVIKPIMPHVLRDFQVFVALKKSFSSFELLHYGEINEDRIFEISKEFINRLAVLQKTSENKMELANIVTYYIKSVKQKSYSVNPTE